MNYFSILPNTLPEDVTSLSNYFPIYNCLHTGSSIICNPPVLNTDIDYVLHINYQTWGQTEQTLRLLGWGMGGSESFEAPTEDNFSRKDFRSWTKGNINIILVGGEGFYNRWVVATRIATKLNLKNKEDRINVFQSVLYFPGEL